MTRIPADALHNHRQEARLQAALQFAEWGWPVLPGADWDGVCWRDPTTGDMVQEGPISNCEPGTIDWQTIVEWWGVGPALTPTVWVAATRFDVISVPREVGRIMRADLRFRSELSPVVHRPDKAREFFLTHFMPDRIRKNLPASHQQLMIHGKEFRLLVPPATVGAGYDVEWVNPPIGPAPVLAPYVEMLALAIRAQNTFSGRP